MQVLTKNGTDITGLYIMVLEGSITKSEFEQKVFEASNEVITTNN